MRNIFTVLIITLSLTGFSLGSQAALEPPAPKALQQIIEKGAQIYYMGEYGGLNGWVLIRQGKPEYFYSTKDGKAMVMGLLFDESGKMLTLAQLQDLKARVGDELYATTAQMPSQQKQALEAVTKTQIDEPTTGTETKSDAVPSDSKPQETEEQTQAEDNGIATPLVSRMATAAEKMYVDLVKANWFTINEDGTHDVFAFIDPDCPHCQQFLKDRAQFIDKGNFRLRVIPVGINGESTARAAVLLASADPEAMIYEYINGNKDVLPASPSANTSAINANTALMLKNNFDVTPVIVYRTKGKKIRLIRGRPMDYDNVIRDINEN